mgnify:CR=1 FL=1
MIALHMEWNRQSGILFFQRVSQFREELSNFNLSFAVAFESGDYGSLVCGAGLM